MAAIIIVMSNLERKDKCVMKRDNIWEQVQVLLVDMEGIQIQAVNNLPHVSVFNWLNNKEEVNKLMLEARNLRSKIQAMALAYR